MSAVFGPYEAGGTTPTIVLQYSLPDMPVSLPGAPAYAVTSHLDVQHPGNPIRPYTFADLEPFWAG